MRFIYMLITFSFLANFAFAQSGQYKRQAAPSPKPEKSGQVDIKGLEEQYWTAQDSEFKVVQNRKYSKAGMLGLSLEFGIQGNDPYTESFGSLTAILSYYWSDFKGIELTYTDFNSKQSEVVDRFRGQFSGTTPNFALLDSYIGLNYNWVPIYGKMSVLDSSIIYFDLAISPGIGMTSYEPQLDTGSLSETALTLSLDISQHFFFTEGWAVRVDMKNRAYTEDRFNFTNGSSQGESNRVVTFWQLGLTYYFGTPFKKKKIEEKDSPQTKAKK